MHRNFFTLVTKKKRLVVEFYLTPGSQIDCLYSGEKSKLYYLISFRADQFISAPFHSFYTVLSKMFFHIR